MNALLIVVDLGRVRALRLSQELGAPSPQFETVTDVRLSDDYAHVQERITDGPGRFPSGNSGMANGERHGEEDAAERAQLSKVADAVGGLIAAEDGDTGVYFAAPQTVHDRLLGALSPASRDRIRQSLPLDLTKVSKLDLLERFDIRLNP